MANTSRIQTVFDSHPNSIDRIVDRLTRSGLDAMTARERDIAADGVGWDTDQNHLGGVAAVLQLAALAGIHAGDFVLDVGCGLGGSLRLLVDSHGCRGAGVDVSSRRIAEASQLNAITGLASSAHFLLCDATAMCFGRGTFSVLWGQNAWAHMFSRALFTELRRVARADARLAFEEVCLARAPVTAVEQRRIAELEELWCLKFRPAKEWSRMVQETGWTVMCEEMITSEAGNYLRALVAKERDRSAHFEDEYRGIVLGDELVSDGLVGYLRLVCTAA